MASTLEEIREVLQEKLPELRERYGVKSLAVFGSYARNEQAGRSDLDLLVELDDRPLTLLQFISLENELTDLLGIRVDLVEKSTLKPALEPRILSDLVRV